MRGRLVLAAVTILAALVLRPAPAPAQGNGPCIHQGRPVQCPQGLPPGSQSVAFVPGGTNWRNSATGAIVFVPSTTFPPFVASPTPTAPPGPATGPGPTAPPAPGPPAGTPGIAFPLSPQRQIYLTQPAAREGGDRLPPAPDIGQQVRKALAEAELKEAKAATQAALKAGQGVLKDLAAEGVAGSVLDPEGIRTKERTRWVFGTYPKFRYAVIRITPAFRAAFDAYEKAIEENKRTPTPANQEKVLEAGRALEAAAAAAPVDQAATDRLQRAYDAIGRTYAAEERAQADLDEVNGKRPAAEGQKAGADAQKPGADVQKSDVEKAPTFEPDGDGKVDDVM